MVCVTMATVGSSQVKHVLAVGVSVLLLCVSSWSSVCELSCSISRAHSVPQPMPRPSAKLAHEAGPSQARAVYSHCGHVYKARPKSAANHSFENTCHCANAPCVQVGTFSSPENARDGAQPEATHFAVVAPVSVIASISFGYTQREGTVPKLLPLDRSSVSLRI
jgi:hypothetical protein